MTHEEQNKQLRQLLQEAMPAVASAWLQSRGEKFGDTFVAIKRALHQQGFPFALDAPDEGGNAQIRNRFLILTT